MERANFLSIHRKFGEFRDLFTLHGMRDSEPRPFPGNARNATPEVSGISPEPYIFHVKSNNYQRHDRPSNVPWNEYCANCWSTKLCSDPRYRRVTSHYLEVSRIELPHQCRWCNNRVAHVCSARACKHCRVTYGKLLQHLGKTGAKPCELASNVVRIESGKEAHYTTPGHD